jgi:hypothetical protein
MEAADHVTSVTTCADEEILQCILNGDETPKRKSKANGWNAHSTTTTSTTNDGQPMRRRKRKFPAETIDPIIDKYTTLDKFKRRQDSIRLSASAIAAMAGFHPYTNLPRLLMDLVYQGPIGKLLLAHDANLLGIELISDEEAVKQIAQKAGTDVKNAVQQAIEISKGHQKVKSVQDASGIKASIMSMVNENRNLTVGEKKQLQEVARSGVNTGFGKEHEEDALDMYQEECGYHVNCRNEDLKCWKFQQNANGVVSPIGPPISLGSASSRSPDKDIIEIDITTNIEIQGDNATATNLNSKAERSKKKKPFFSIVGVADGIRDEFYPKSDGRDEDWDLRQVIVECKHRMKRAFVPPPIYDQIQVVLYCMMYGTSEGELVQVVRNGQSNSTMKEMTDSKKLDPEDTTKKSKEKKQATPAPKKSMSITCNRVSLNDPIMNHLKNWHETVLPRLASFVKAVYSVRKDDDKRYRMIRASALASSGGDEDPYWNILFEECPWLVDCDIAFSKKFQEKIGRDLM